MSYRRSLISHLSSYKKGQLGIQEPGLFRYRDQDVKRDHILPVRDQWQNLLPGGREVTRAYLDQHRSISLHRYFHHLTSSQAFAFNLFIPFFEGGTESSSALIRALGQNGRLAEWEPEAIPDPREGTNFDAWWKLESGLETFCEVKLCEGGFGKCAADAKHRDKLQSTYAPRLQGHVSAEVLSEEQFFPNYQVLRNIWHLVGSDSAELIFLMPRANSRLWRQLDAIMSKVDPGVREKVRSVAIETVLETLVADPTCPPAFVDIARQMQEKYIPASQA